MPIRALWQGAPIHGAIEVELVCEVGLPIAPGERLRAIGVSPLDTDGQIAFEVPMVGPERRMGTQCMLVATIGHLAGPGDTAHLPTVLPLRAVAHVVEEVQRLGVASAELP